MAKKAKALTKAENHDLDLLDSDCRMRVATGGAGAFYREAYKQDVPKLLDVIAALRKRVDHGGAAQRKLDKLLRDFDFED